jgi:hypothetical protein
MEPEEKKVGQGKGKPKRFPYVLLGQYMIFMAFVLILAAGIFNVSNSTFMTISWYILPVLGISTMVCWGIYENYQKTKENAKDGVKS